MSDAADVVTDRLDQLLAELDPRTTDPVEFRGRQYDLGLAWVHFPEGYGGLGLPPREQRRIESRLHAAGAPSITSRHFFGLTMAGPTVVTAGSDALKQRLPKRMFTGEAAPCQPLSQPG